MVEIKQAGQGFDAERPGFEPLDPVPEWLFPYRHLCIHLLAKTVSPRIERPIRHCGLQRKVERRADAEQHREQTRQVCARLGTLWRNESGICFGHAQCDQGNAEDRKRHRPAARGADKASTPKPIKKSPRTRLLKALENAGMGCSLLRLNRWHN